MQLTQLAESIKDYGRDIRLNLSTALSEEGAPGLNQQQIWSVALACAYACKNQALVAAVQADADLALSAEYREAAKAAATIMAMNNVYYRFTHLVEDPTISKMPARLRMNVIGKPGISKIDFELQCLAVSAINGCGACMKAHVHEVVKAGLSHESCQSAVRIAAVINAAAQALTIG